MVTPEVSRQLEVESPQDFRRVYELSTGLLNTCGTVEPGEGSRQARTFGWEDVSTGRPYLIYQTRENKAYGWERPHIATRPDQPDATETGIWLDGDGSYGVYVGEQAVDQARAGGEIVGRIEASILTAARGQLFRLCAEALGAEPNAAGSVLLAPEGKMTVRLGGASVDLEAWDFRLDDRGGAPFVMLTDGHYKYDVSCEELRLLGDTRGYANPDLAPSEIEELTRLLHILSYSDQERAVADVAANTHENGLRVAYDLERAIKDGYLRRIINDPKEFSLFVSGGARRAVVTAVINAFSPRQKCIVPHALGIITDGPEIVADLVEVPLVGTNNFDGADRLRINYFTTKDSLRAEAYRYTQGRLQEASIKFGNEAASQLAGLLQHFIYQVLIDKRARPYTGNGEHFRAGELRLHFER